MKHREPTLSSWTCSIIHTVNIPYKRSRTPLSHRGGWHYELWHDGALRPDTEVDNLACWPHISTVLQDQALQPPNGINTTQDFLHVTIKPSACLLVWMHGEVICEIVPICVFTYACIDTLCVCVCVNASLDWCPLAWATLSLHWAVKCLQYPLMVVAPVLCERLCLAATCTLLYTQRLSMF